MLNCYFCLEKRGLGVVMREQNFKIIFKQYFRIEDLVVNEDIIVGYFSVLSLGELGMFFYNNVNIMVQLIKFWVDGSGIDYCVLFFVFCFFQN